MLGDSVSLRLAVAPLFDEENPNEKRLMAIVSVSTRTRSTSVKVLSLYNVANWNNASLTSSARTFAIWPSSSPRLSRFVQSTTLKLCGFKFTLVFRKENLMACEAFKAMASSAQDYFVVEVVPCVIKIAMEHLACHGARSLRHAIITSISTSYARSRSIDRCTPVCDERNDRIFALVSIFFLKRDACLL